MSRIHKESHQIERIGWLRAAVLGANDGIVSTASLVLGVAAAHGTHESVLIAGIAGLFSGAMSMATGEYISVHSQSDTEKAALEEERSEIEADFHSEHRELSAFMFTGALICRLQTKLRLNSWSMMLWVRMRVMS